MIARKFNTRSQCTILEVDPHCKFICLYFPYINSLQIININDITIHYLQEVNQFYYQQKYSFFQDKNIKLLHQLSKEQLFKDKVSDIKISKFYKGTQLIACSDGFQVKVFKVEIINKQNNQQIKLNIKFMGQIFESNMWPITSITFYYHQIHINRFNQGVVVFQYNERKSIWYPKLQQKEFQNQDKRILIYVQNAGRQYKDSRRINHIQFSEQFLERQQSNRALLLQLKQKKYIKLYQNMDQLNLMYGIMTVNQQFLQRQYSNTPKILFKTNHNKLKSGQFIKDDKKKQLTLCKLYRRPKQFPNDDIQQIYCTLLSYDFPHYRISQCENYIVCTGYEFIYKIRSKQFKWQEVYCSRHRPYIHPFYYKIQENIFFTMYPQQTSGYTRELKQILHNNYQFILIAACVKDTIAIQLIIINKHKQNKRRGDNLQQTVVKIKIKQFRKTRGRNKHKKMTQKKIIRKFLKNSKKLYRNSRNRIQHEWKVINLFTIKSIEEEVFQVKWISDSEFLYLSRQGNIYYFNILNEQIVKKIYKIYQYLAKNSIFRTEFSTRQALQQCTNKKWRETDEFHKHVNHLPTQKYQKCLKKIYQKVYGRDRTKKQYVPYYLQIYGWDKTQYSQIKFQKTLLFRNINMIIIIPLIFPQNGGITRWQTRELINLEKQKTQHLQKLPQSELEIYQFDTTTDQCSNYEEENDNPISQILNEHQCIAFLQNIHTKKAVEYGMKGIDSLFDCHQNNTIQKILNKIEMTQRQKEGDQFDISDETSKLEYQIKKRSFYQFNILVHQTFQLSNYYLFKNLENQFYIFSTDRFLEDRYKKKLLVSSLLNVYQLTSIRQTRYLQVNQNHINYIQYGGYNRKSQNRNDSSQQNQRIYDIALNNREFERLNSLVRQQYLKHPSIQEQSQEQQQKKQTKYQYQNNSTQFNQNSNINYSNQNNQNDYQDSNNLNQQYHQYDTQFQYEKNQKNQKQEQQQEQSHQSNYNNETTASIQIDNHEITQSIQKIRPLNRKIHDCIRMKSKALNFYFHKYDKPYKKKYSKRNQGQEENLQDYQFEDQYYKNADGYQSDKNSNQQQNQSSDKSSVGDSIHLSQDSSQDDVSDQQSSQSPCKNNQKNENEKKNTNKKQKQQKFKNLILKLKPKNQKQQQKTNDLHQQTQKFNNNQQQQSQKSIFLYGNLNQFNQIYPSSLAKAQPRQEKEAQPFSQYDKQYSPQKHDHQFQQQQYQELNLSRTKSLQKPDSLKKISPTNAVFNQQIGQSFINISYKVKNCQFNNQNNLKNERVNQVKQQGKQCREQNEQTHNENFQNNDQVSQVKNQKQQYQGLNESVHHNNFQNIKQANQVKKSDQQYQRQNDQNNNNDSQPAPNTSKTRSLDKKQQEQFQI